MRLLSAPLLLALLCGCAVVVNVFASAGSSEHDERRSVLVWMCLERCGESAAEIQAELKELAAHKDVITDVAFEMFNLGANSTLLLNNLTRVASALQSMGFRTWAMVSSYPYPPEFLTWMQELFANPQPFIDAALQAGRAHNLTGFNIDFEPTSQASPSDARAYASFLSTFANALHKAGLHVSVDAASWSAIWNYTLLGASSVDKVITMQTYSNASNIAQWTQYLDSALSGVGGASRLGVGLECDVTLSDAQLAQRILLSLRANVTELDVWRTPIPDSWWPQLQRFRQGDGV